MSLKVLELDTKHDDNKKVLDVLPLLYLNPAIYYYLPNIIAHILFNSSCTKRPRGCFIIKIVQINT